MNVLTGDINELERATKGNDPNAQYRLGALYISMEDIVVARKGVALLTKAANQGLPEAQCLLGSLMAENEDRIPGLYEQGAMWYLHAAQQGLVEAQASLAYLYLLGRGVPFDEQQAFQWYETAAEKGGGRYQSNLAYMHAHGIGTVRNEHLATHWYLEAAARGDARALYNLGLRCLKGLGVQQDRLMACAFLKHAANHDYPGSRDCLSQVMTGMPDDELKMVERLVEDPLAHVNKLAQDGSASDIGKISGMTSGVQRCRYTEVVSWSPRAFKIHNFLSYDECDHLVDLAIRHAGSTEAEIGKDIGKRFHQGLTTFFKLPICDATIYNLEQRIAATIMVPADHGEMLSVMHFSEKEDYATHVDFFRPEIPVMKKLYDQAGQRVVTFLMYLSDVQEGGETAYPLAGKKIQPRKGMGATHFNCLPSGEVDEMSQHAGLHVKKGDKWFARKVIRERSMFEPVTADIVKPGIPTAIDNKKYTPGRNDPCPCGSGKKYKKCCGK